MATTHTYFISYYFFIYFTKCIINILYFMKMSLKYKPYILIRGFYSLRVAYSMWAAYSYCMGIKRPFKQNDCWSPLVGLYFGRLVQQQQHFHQCLPQQSYLYCPPLFCVDYHLTQEMLALMACWGQHLALVVIPEWKKQQNHKGKNFQPYLHMVKTQNLDCCNT